jgi:UTP--glucose-1-phosphate uridylyltransferase
MNNDINITRAVIPAAGLGTRMLAVSDMVPKEMLTLGDRCMIEYSIKEAVDSGITDILVLINKNKNILRDYLLERLTKSWRKGSYAGLKLNFIYQNEPRGVADAYLLAKDFVENEPFAVLVPDNITIGKTPITLQLIDVFKQYKKDLIGVIRVNRENASLFGNCGGLEYNMLENNVLNITRLEDKGEGTFSVKDDKEVFRGIARYIATGKFFDCIEHIKKETAGELDDVPAFQKMIKDEGLLGVIVEGEVFDAGQPPGYYKADERLRKDSDIT